MWGQGRRQEDCLWAVSHVCVHVYVTLAKLSDEICLIPRLSLNAWTLFALLLQSQSVWGGEGWAEVLAIFYNCCIAAPLPLYSVFFRISQTFLRFGVKSRHCFHLVLQCLTPYSFVSIKTLEHWAVFGFEVFCVFVWTAEPAFFLCNCQHHFPKGGWWSIKW